MFVACLHDLFDLLVCFVLALNVLHVFQTKRHKSKKGGVQRRVYFWGGISWWAKTKGVAWTAEDTKVLFRHTKNVCVGTLFEDDGVVYRAVQTRGMSDDGNVYYYVNHFDYPDTIPDEQHYSSHREVKECHDASRAELAQCEDLQPPNGMQDTSKTLEIYADALYPALREQRIKHIVEDNASPHNNDAIRESHREHGAHIVGYTATDEDKEEIVRLIEEQTRNYRRAQDRKAQLTKQTRELDRLPAWTSNSPDLNLIETVWSWMVKAIRDGPGGWPSNPQDIKARVLQAWDDIPIESFRDLIRSYRVRLVGIYTRDGDRHPHFA